jgi:beta-barrel assembly-enhancing protease
MRTPECVEGCGQGVWHLAIAVACAVLAFAASCAQSSVQRLGLPASASEAEVAEASRLSQLALDRWLEHEIRLQRISQQLRVAGRELCGSDLTPVLGITVSGTEAVPESLVSAAELRFGDERMRVVDVFPGMAAEAAGVKVDDVVLSVGGRGVRSETSVYRPVSPGEPLALRVSRGGQELELQISNALGCGYASGLLILELVNAAASSGERSTYFTNAMMRALDSDVHLAFVVGHELGHIIIDRVAETNDGRQADEAQADYIGAYLAVRAGYPLDVEDVRLFDALSLGDLNTIDRRSRTHPVTPARTVALRETLLEIEQKRRAGEPLIPSGKSPLTR